MKVAEKILFLKRNHFSEWARVRGITEDELSQKQPAICICGRLATGFHERSCKKFNTVVDKTTAKKLLHLLKDIEHVKNLSLILNK